MRQQNLAGHPATVRQPCHGLLQIPGIACAINLGAVAGREQRRFQRIAYGFAQMLQSGCNLIHRIGKASAQIQRCSGVVQPQGPDRHKL